MTTSLVSSERQVQQNHQFRQLGPDGLQDDRAKGDDLRLCEGPEYEISLIAEALVSLGTEAALSGLLALARGITVWDASDLHLALQHLRSAGMLDEEEIFALWKRWNSCP